MATIAAIAALGTAAAAGYGAYETSKAGQRAGAQNAMALDEQRRQLALAAQQAEMARAGRTDARGNRSQYIPGQGWVDTPSPITAALMSRSDQEELRRVSEDLPRQRMQREALFRQQQDDRGLAGAMLARTNVGTRSLADVEADATRLGVARAVSGPQQAERDAVITALRQGTGAEASLAAAARGARDNTRVALEEARSGAPRAFADADSARLNDAMNRYHQLASRAFAVDNMPFVPNDTADTLTAAALKQQQTGAYQLANAQRQIDVPKLQDTNYTALAIKGLADSANYLGNNKALAAAYNNWFGPTDPGANALRSANMTGADPQSRSGW